MKINFDDNWQYWLVRFLRHIVEGDIQDVRPLVMSAFASV